MREIRLSGLEGGVALIRHPYPYLLNAIVLVSIFLMVVVALLAAPALMHQVR